jgi:hypothetical protein
MKSHEELNKVFGIVPTEVVEIKSDIIKEPVPESEGESKDIQSDYDLARNTLRNLIEKGEEALDDMMAVAKGSEHPRAFEVTSTLVNTIAGAAKDLLSLQKTMKEIKKPAAGEPSNTPQNVTNNNIVFQGTTSELLNHIKDARKKVIDV